MTALGTLGKATAAGVVTGAVAGFVAGGPAGAVTGAQAGATLGAKAGCLLKAEQGADAAGRKVELIITNTTEKIGDSVEKVGDKVGKSAEELGVAVGKAATTAMDKLTDALINAATNFTKEYGGIAVAVVAAQGIAYILNNTADLIYKNCQNGSFSSVPCSLHTIGLTLEYGSIAVIGACITIKIKKSLLS